MKKELKEKYKDCIVDIYMGYLEKNHKDPTSKEFHEYLEFTDDDKENGVSSWKDVFKNISEIRALAMEKYPERVSELTFTEQDFCTPEYLERAQEAIRTHKRFIVATAVNNKPVDVDFLNSILTFAKEKDAVPLWLAAHDVKNAKRVYQFNFDPLLKNGFIITTDTALNDNCMLSGIVASAKQINPLSGLERLCGRGDHSIIFPGCKQLLKHIAMLNRNVKSPHKATCTGAVTVADYRNDFLMSGRTSYLAEKDHQLGAIIIEIEDEKRFHLRHVQASTGGSFTDLGTVYHPDGTTSKSKNAVFVMGDSHVGFEDKVLLREILRLFKDEEFITEVVVHDIDNASSISHHESNNLIKRIARAKDGSDDLLRETNQIVGYLNGLTACSNLNVTVVNSNHDRHVERYLESGRFVYDRDYKNAETAMELTLAYVRGSIKNPVQYLAEKVATVPLNNPERIKWLRRDESYTKYNVELGIHGDEGANGGKGSLKTYEKSLYNAVVAHSHTGGIQHKIFQVGTTSLMNMGYNHGLSSWTRTCCLVYEDGTKQLIDFIPSADKGYTYSA